MIFFIAGIHGVGKGTICRQIESQTGFKHFTASELIKWNKISEDGSKLVEDIPSTQELLIGALNEKRQAHSKILLDGHFVLLSNLSEPTPIDFDVFREISPDVIICLELAIDTILQRLSTRDDKHYSRKVLEEMQNLELECSANCANFLKVPYIRAESTDISSIITQIKLHESTT